VKKIKLVLREAVERHHKGRRWTTMSVGH
jgi:hypothetical protein